MAQRLAFIAIVMLLAYPAIGCRQGGTRGGTPPLRVVDGRIQIPDLRLEYDTADGDLARVDLELATEHYKPAQMAAKARAGFTLYAPASQTGRLRAVLEERDLLAENRSL